MKRIFPAIAVLLSAVLLLTACGGAAAPSPTPAISVDDQVQTAVAATATAQAAMDETIENAVQATITALPPTPTPGPTVEYYSLSEEELAALIDESVDEALTASEQASTATTQATADGTVTYDEVYAATAYAYDAEAAIYYAEELMEAYFELYGAYADEAIAVLTATEQDLNSIATSLEAMVVILEQGAEVASAALEQLNAAAEELAPVIEQAQTNAQDWMDEVHASMQAREEKMLSLAPTEVASDRAGAIQQMYDYLDTVKAALGDRQITPDELNRIAQLGANAQASIRAGGGPQLQNIGPSIDGLTRQLSRGEWPQAGRSLGGFEASLPSRPTRR
ncbi:MAG: hypothetical protein GXP40_06155 [Chloroflexi bacterium]|nr:hypothetical protein [Chloroflexota bacterium]